jgi:succinate-semialdehyde dehydrogenase / glutarate-semialdehyde dehydrogenase
LEDADLEHASTLCTKARLINSGQSCIAGKRFVVAEPVRARFEQLFVQKMAAAKVGDPLREDTEVGPLARADLRETVHRQVAKSIEMGARCLLGGRKHEGPGFYYLPTVLSDVRKGMPAYDEEVFGPVAAIIGAKDEQDAIAIGNDTVFGLGSGVLTRDLARGERIATFMLESGMSFVNEAVRSDPRLPFGGMKHSGYGRELSEYGIKEFVNIKSVYVGIDPTGKIRASE